MRQEAPELQYIQALSQRVKLTKKEQHALQHALQGYNGECLFDRCLPPNLAQPEFCMDDVDLSYQGSHCQIDKLLVIGDIAYLIDIKNYDGHYQYHDGSWYYDGKVLAHNIFEQITRAQGIVARCLSDQGLQMSVKSVLVFMKSTVQLDLTAPPPHIKLMDLSQACGWLIEMSLDLTTRSDLLQQPWQRALQHYFIPAYRPPNDLSSTPQRPFHRGVCCLKCGHFKMKQSRFVLTCQNCGTPEAKKHAYVRTICDYGVLYFKKDLRRHDLCEFFGEGYSERYIVLMLQKNFIPKCTSLSRNYSYWNEGVSFQYWFQDRSDYFREIQQRVNWDKK